MESESNLSEKFIVVDPDKKNISLSLSKTTLTVNESSGLQVECPLDHVLWSEVTDDHKLLVSLLYREKKGLALYSKIGSFDETLHEAAEKWSSLLMKAAYDVCKPRRRFKVMINPRGGPGNALSSFEEKVKPIFEAANCSLDILVTERYKHCYDYTKSMQLDYDAIVVLSGDGLVHEIFNAFAERGDAMDAFTIPVVQIPTGSGNGFSIALLGLENGLDVCAAALNAIKGRHMKFDLCSVQQDGKRIISFMSQTIGMGAELDLGTEHLRWMGDARFIIGFLRAVVFNRICPVKLEIKIAAQDKQEMLKTYRSLRLQTDTVSEPERTEASRSIPPLQHAEGDEGWTVIDNDLSYLYGGKMPYVSRDVMMFPVALCNDGCIDIVAQQLVSRMKMVKGLISASEGKQYWEPTQLYFKAKAYRVTPVAANGLLSLDGEKYPYSSFQVDVLHRLGTTLGLGGWCSDFCP